MQQNADKARRNILLWLFVSIETRFFGLTPEFSCKHSITIAAKPHPKVLVSCNVR